MGYRTFFINVNLKGIKRVSQLAREFDCSLREDRETEATD